MEMSSVSVLGQHLLDCTNASKSLLAIYRIIVFALARAETIGPYEGLMATYTHPNGSYPMDDFLSNHSSTMPASETKLVKKHTWTGPSMRSSMKYQPSWTLYVQLGSELYFSSPPLPLERYNKLTSHRSSWRQQESRRLRTGEWLG